MNKVNNDITAAEAAEISAEKSNSGLAKELERIFQVIRSAANRGENSVSLTCQELYRDYSLGLKVGEALDKRGFKHEFDGGGPQWDPSPPSLRISW